jgi:hypothetical protein
MATKKEKVPDLAKHMANWTTCNEFLRDATEDQAAAALKFEQQNKKRLQYLLRIHSRMNKVRAERERAELLSVGA